jgi:Ca-activated chloride channel family protein
MTATTTGIELRTATNTEQISLRGVHLHARLSGMSQKTTVEQTFVNLQSQAIEAVYTFPLPEGAAVCEFEVVTGDHVLTGAVEESDVAVEKYEEAISAGHGAFMVEQNRPDVFTCRVGNIKPRQAATIRLIYVCALNQVDKSIRVAFPTTIAPRYVTSTAADPIDAAIDGDALNPPHVLNVPYGLSIEVDIALRRELTKVTSPSHRINVVNGEDGTCRVTFAGGIAEMDRDVVLLLDLKREHEPKVEVAAGRERESYLAVTFVPEFEERELVDSRAGETIFVLDCSGSMQGDSIQQATAALELCLRSMSLGDTFNICRFGSTFEMLSSESLIYSQQTLDRAIEYVRKPADLGGTELYQPLQAILSIPPRAGTVRNVILLTDGQVSNEPAVIELARLRRNHNRIFSFGIGTACSAFLVKGIARATGGASEFITSGERIDEKVLRTFGRIASPPVTDVIVDWNGAEVQTLAELPPVFDGDVLSVFGRAPLKTPKKVTLRCNTPTGPRSWTVNVPSAIDDGGVIATMWARRTIQSLEEVNNISANKVTSGEKPREQQMVIALSKQFGLLSCLTTFVAIEHRSVQERNEGKPELRRVPVNLAAGWGGTDTVLSGPPGYVAYAAPMAPTAGATTLGAAGGVSGAVAGAIASASGIAKKRPRGRMLSVPPPISPAHPASANTLREPAPQQSAPSDLMALLSSQAADGSFSWNKQQDEIAARATVDMKHLRELVTKELDSTALRLQQPRWIDTVAMCMILLTKFSADESLWRRAFRKACRDFLAPALGKSADEVEAWLQAIKAKLP